MGKTLASGETVHGIKAIQLRNALRRFTTGAFGPDALAPILKLSHAEVSQLISCLVKDGILTPDRDYFALSKVGYAFCLARGTKPIARSRAENLLREAIAACAEINADGTHPNYIKGLYVFGSALGRSETVGDLDLAIDLSPRASGLTSAQWEDWQSAYGNARAPNGASFIDVLCWAELSIRRRIKNRSRYVSVHTLAEIDKLRAPRRLVFEATTIAAPLTDLEAHAQ